LPSFGKKIEALYNQKSQNDLQVAHLERRGDGRLITKKGNGTKATYTVERFIQGKLTNCSCYPARQFERNYIWFL
jgi:ribosomal protein S2